MQLPEEFLTPKSRKKQTTKNRGAQQRGNNAQFLQGSELPATMRNGQRPSKRSMQKMVPNPFPQQEMSPSDLLSDTSPGGDDGYRLLRHKCLMLEEEGFALDRETMEVEDQVKTLEDEKLALLDQLVVLEGLVDPLEFKPLSGHLP